MANQEEATELLQLLHQAGGLYEQSETFRVIMEFIKTNKDALHMVNGLVDFYIVVHSDCTLRLLMELKQSNAKVLFDRLNEHLKTDNEARRWVYQLFGCFVRNHFSWISAVFTHSFLPHMLKHLRAENDAINLVSGILVLVCLLPQAPIPVAPFIGDLLHIFHHGALFNLHSTTEQLPFMIRAHVHIALYSLFHRLYAMFPNHTIEFTRNLLKRRENADLFEKLLKEFLDRVRFHPLLVVTNKDGEISPNRWRKKESSLDLHDIVFDCSRFSLDMIEATAAQLEFSLIPSMTSPAVPASVGLPRTVVPASSPGSLGGRPSRRTGGVAMAPASPPPLLHPGVSVLGDASSATAGDGDGGGGRRVGDNGAVLSSTHGGQNSQQLLVNEVREACKVLLWTSSATDSTGRRGSMTTTTPGYPAAAATAVSNNNSSSNTAATDCSALVSGGQRGSLSTGGVSVQTTSHPPPLLPPGNQLAGLGNRCVAGGLSSTSESVAGSRQHGPRTSQDSTASNDLVKSDDKPKQKPSESGDTSTSNHINNTTPAGLSELEESWKGRLTASASRGPCLEENLDHPVTRLARRRLMSLPPQGCAPEDSSTPCCQQKSSRPWWTRGEGENMPLARLTSITSQEMLAASSSALVDGEGGLDSAGNWPAAQSEQKDLPGARASSSGSVWVPSRSRANSLPADFEFSSSRKESREREAMNERGAENTEAEAPVSEAKSKKERSKETTPRRASSVIPPIPNDSKQGLTLPTTTDSHFLDSPAAYRPWSPLPSPAPPPPQHHLTTGGGGSLHRVPLPYEMLFAAAVPYAPLAVCSQCSFVSFGVHLFTGEALEGKSGAGGVPGGPHNVEMAPVLGPPSPLHMRVAPAELLDRIMTLSQAQHVDLPVQMPQCGISLAQLTDVGPEAELRILRSQVHILHSQVLLERHRREQHAQRNRRLVARLVRLKNAETEADDARGIILERDWEVNKSKETLRRAERKISALTANLTGVREQWRQEVNTLSGERDQMQHTIVQLKQRVEDKHREVREANKENENLRNLVLSQDMDVICLRQQVDQILQIKSQLEEAHKRLVLLGGVQNRYCLLFDEVRVLEIREESTRAILERYEEESRNMSIKETEELVVSVEAIQLEAVRTENINLNRQIGEYKRKMTALDEYYNRELKSLRQKLTEREMACRKHQHALQEAEQTRSQLEAKINRLQRAILHDNTAASIATGGVACRRDESVQTSPPTATDEEVPGSGQKEDDDHEGVTVAPGGPSSSPVVLFAETNSPRKPRTRNAPSGQSPSMGGTASSGHSESLPGQMFAFSPHRAAASSSSSAATNNTGGDYQSIEETDHPTSPPDHPTGILTNYSLPGVSEQSPLQNLLQDFFPSQSAPSNVLWTGSVAFSAFPLALRDGDSTQVVARTTGTESHELLHHPPDRRSSSPGGGEDASVRDKKPDQFVATSSST